MKSMPEWPNVTTNTKANSTKQKQQMAFLQQLSLKIAASGTALQGNFFHPIFYLLK